MLQRLWKDKFRRDYSTATLRNPAAAPSLTLLADVTGDGDAQAPPLVLEELNAVFLLLRQQQPLLQSWQS